MKPSFSQWISRRTLVRLAALGAISLLALWAGFFLFTPEQGLSVFQETGYPLLLVTVGLWAVCCVLSLQRELRNMRWGGPGAVFLFVTLVVFFYRTAEEPGYNIAYDEPQLAASALQIHVQRDFGVPLVTEWHEGEYRIVSSHLYKRPFLYPFLVASLHDLTGYRVGNNWMVNHLLAGGLLVLIYLLGHHLAGRLGGWLAIGFFAGLPILAHSAVGAGLDLVNSCLLVLLLWLALRFAQDPEARGRANALILTGVLLAQSRTEAVIFIPLVAALFLTGCFRIRRLLFPWSLYVAPLLMIPTAWHLRIFQTNTAFFEFLETAEPFGLQHLFGWGEAESNLGHAANFFFATDPYLAMTWPLMVVPLAAWGLVLLFLIRAPETRPASFPILLFFIGGVLLHLLLLFCYYWGQLDDPLAMRFALPSLVVLTLGIPLALAMRPASRPLRLGLTAGVFSTVLFVSIPCIWFHSYAEGTYLAREISWIREQAARLDPSRSYVIDKHPNTWVVERLATSPFVLRPDTMKKALEQGVVGEFYIYHRLMRDRPKNRAFLEEGRNIPQGWRQAEIVAQGSFAPDLLVRIIRIEPES